MKASTLISLLAAPTAVVSAVIKKAANSTSPITTTKITASYWRATFSDPPFNLQTRAFYESFSKVVDEIVNDPDVKVVVFDSSAEHFCT